MIDNEYVTVMADYNRWQNQNMLQAIATLDDGERRSDRGAFFGSIEATCNHVLWGDQIWLSRFSDHAPPAVDNIAASVQLTPDWASFVVAREQTDTYIVNWARELDGTRLQTDLHYYSGAAKRDISKPLGQLIVHFFNHQTHHRGQIHAMLTACGVDTAPTDLPMMPSH